MSAQSRFRVKNNFPQLSAAVQTGILQRKCASCGNHTIAGGKCETCENKKGVLQRKSLNNSEHLQVPPILNEVLNTAGQPLDKSTRSYFEPRFGYDFSHVRVHGDSKAAESADAVDALAYTVSNKVVFGQGRYSPDTRAGKKLLAHELAHVVQQERSGNKIQRQGIEAGKIADAAGADEREAEELAAAVAESAAENEFIGDGNLKLFRKPNKDDKKSAPKVKPKSSKLTAAEVTTLINANNKSNVSTELLLCLIWKESGFDPKDKSSKSTATGLMQMTKPAVKQVNESTPKGVHFTHGEMTDSAKNIECGTYYLKIRIDWAKGDLTKGLEGFGTGSGYAANILQCETCSKDPANNADDCLKAIHP